MNLGVTLIDMGSATTGICVFHEGRMVFADSIPLGGQHITNDIAQGLSTTIAHAERMKTLWGSAIPSGTDPIAPANPAMVSRPQGTLVMADSLC